LLYGEGRRAFYRLQEKIMDVHEDYTIFAWTEKFGDWPGHASDELRPSPGHVDGILAKSPANFQGLGRWGHLPMWRPYSELYTSISEAALSMPRLANYNGGVWEIEPPTLTSRGLSISLPIRRKSDLEYQACLTCTRSSTNCYFLCLTLQPLYKHTEPGDGISSGNTHTYTTAATGLLDFESEAEVNNNPFQYATIYLARSSVPSAVRVFAPVPKVQVHPWRMLTVLTDEHCSIADSFMLLQQKDNNRNLNQLPAN
jgi:hypothetical protein